MTGKKGMRHYPQEVKLEAVRLFFKLLELNPHDGDYSNFFNHPFESNNG
jgi:hypothetical protein